MAISSSDEWSIRSFTQIEEHLVELAPQDLLEEERAEEARQVLRRALPLGDDDEGVVDDREEDVHQDEDDEDGEAGEEDRREDAVRAEELVIVEDAEHELEERDERGGDRAVTVHVEAEGEVEGHREAEDDDREEEGEEEELEAGDGERAEEEVHLRDHREELEDLDDEQQRTERVEVLHRLQLEHEWLQVDVLLRRHRLDLRLDLQRVPEGVDAQQDDHQREQRDRPVEQVPLVRPVLGEGPRPRARRSSRDSRTT